MFTTYSRTGHSYKNSNSFGSPTHFTADKKRTLCGRDCSEWNFDDAIEITGPSNSHCERCSKKYFSQEKLPMTDNPNIIKEALLPCPFCGHGAGIDEVNAAVEGVTFEVGCENFDDCPADAPAIRGFARRSEAIKAWNARTPEGQEMFELTDENENVIGYCSIDWIKSVNDEVRLNDAFAKYKRCTVLVTKKED